MFRVEIVVSNKIALPAAQSSQKEGMLRIWDLREAGTGFTLRLVRGTNS